MQVFILQTAIANYRINFFTELKKLLYDEFELISISFVFIFIELFSKGTTKLIFL